jgi:hypothetical protein
MKLEHLVLAGTVAVGSIFAADRASASFVSDQFVDFAQLSGGSLVADLDGDGTDDFVSTTPGASEAAVTEWFDALAAPDFSALATFRDEGAALGTANGCVVECSTSPSSPFNFEFFVVKAGTLSLAFADTVNDGFADYDLDALGLSQATSNITYISTVPVPAALPLLGTAVAGLAIWRRRRQA